MAKTAQNSKPRNTPNLYRAEVLDNEDPEHYFRVKLKIHGITGDDITKDGAVWAEVMQGTTPGIDKKIGISSVIQVGTMVWCMLEEGDPNKPVVIGVLSGKDDCSDELAGDKYINAQSLTTKSGHKIVIDDSGGDETIHIYHCTGTFIKIDHNGDIFVNGVRDCQFDIARDATWNVQGNMTINVKGNRTTNIEGTDTVTVNGDKTSNYNANESITVGSEKTENIGSNNNTTIGSNNSINVGSNYSLSAQNVSVNSPQSSFSGNVSVGGNLNCGGGRSRSGGMGIFTGTVQASNDCIGGGISLKSHTHGVIQHSETTPPR